MHDGDVSVIYAAVLAGLRTEEVRALLAAHGGERNGGAASYILTG